MGLTQLGGETAPVPELQERWASAARDAQGGIVGVSVQGRELHWMVLVGPFQLRTFHDSLSSWYHTTLSFKGFLNLFKGHLKQQILKDI